MSIRFRLFIFLIYFLTLEFAQPQILHPDCFPDKEQKCDKDSLNVEWPDTKMRFLLFTRRNRKEPEMLHLCNGTLPRNTQFNPKNKLYVFIPGFMFGTCEIDSIPGIKDKLLEKGDFNVILIVNVEEYGHDFLLATENVEKVANVTVRVLQNIQAKVGLKSKNVHLIGHSLGAQACGLIGKQFKVHRITGLDPAGVTYTKDTPKDKRLDESDADLVDFMHTNGGSGLPYLGAYFPSGTADFYVNDGTNQPSCAGSMWNAVKNFKLLYGFGVSSVPSVCAHVKCIEYYEESISNPGKFVAWPCSSYKKFKSGNCTGNGASSVIMGYGFEESFTPEQRKKPFPRKYYTTTD